MTSKQGSGHWRNTAAYRARRDAFWRGQGASPTCWICSKPINTRLSGRSMDGPTIDHVRPAAYGDVDPLDVTNWRPAHRRCNIGRGVDLRGQTQQGCRDRWNPGTFLRRIGDEMKPSSDFDDGRPVATHRVNADGEVVPLSPNR